MWWGLHIERDHFNWLTVNIVVVAVAVAVPVTVAVRIVCIFHLISELNLKWIRLNTIVSGIIFKQSTPKCIIAGWSKEFFMENFLNYLNLKIIEINWIFFPRNCHSVISLLYYWLLFIFSCSLFSAFFQFILRFISLECQSLNATV